MDELVVGGVGVMTETSELCDVLPTTRELCDDEAGPTDLSDENFCDRSRRSGYLLDEDSADGRKSLESTFDSRWEGALELVVLLLDKVRRSRAREASRTSTMTTRVFGAGIELSWHSSAPSSQTLVLFCFSILLSMVASYY